VLVGAVLFVVVASLGIGYFRQVGNPPPPDPEPIAVNPGLRLVNPLVYSLIVAPTRAGIADATNSATAGRASVAASDPRGVPAVWEVTP